MDMIVSTVVSDLVTRLISHLITTYKKHTNVEEKLRRLEHVLLKIHATVDEAKGRHITNQGMLLQLKRFLQGMYQGYYILDTFQCRHEVQDDMADEVNSYFASALSNPAKRLRLIANNAKATVLGDKEVDLLQKVLENLEAISAHIHAFNTLLGGYPCRFQQPYSTNLYTDKCIFHRQAERERIINILLKPEPPSNTSNVGILPIVGCVGSGKRTLVEDVCNDEMVRNYFARIIELDEEDLESSALEARRQSWEIENRNFRSNKHLVLVEFSSKVNKDAWRRFYFSAGKCMGAGSKIIIMSVLEEVTSLGSVSPIRLKHMTDEAHWYFFKMLAFGNVNPEEHPKLLRIAMEIAKVLDKGGFVGANVFGSILRANQNIQFWSDVLQGIMEIRKSHFISLQNHPTNFPMENHGNSVPRISFESVPVPSCCGSRHIYFMSKRKRGNTIHRVLPELTFSDIFSHRVEMIPAEVKFEVVTWKSLLPPYSYYVATCIKHEGDGNPVYKKQDVQAPIGYLCNSM